MRCSRCRRPFYLLFWFSVRSIFEEAELYVFIFVELVTFSFQLTNDWGGRGKRSGTIFSLMLLVLQTWAQLFGLISSVFECTHISKMAMNAHQCIVPSLQSRQLGILSPKNFSRDTSGSCGLVKRLTLHDKLVHHDGCVNTLHFNMSGELLASGSDDLDIVIWDWAKGKKKLAYESGHSSNVFQVKELIINDMKCSG